MILHTLVFKIVNRKVILGYLW